MMLRLEWRRLRRRWVCCGVGLVCAAGAMSGCSRAPMARFKELTSAPATDAEGESPATSDAAERPDPRDAVAQTREPEGRVTIVGDGRRGSFRRARESYADLTGRLLNRQPTASSDPFLDPQQASGPASPAPRPQRIAPPQSPPIDGTVARAELRPQTAATVDTASLQQPRESGAGVVIIPATPRTRTDRVEQLRAEVRREAERQTQSARELVAVADTDRGSVLSDPRNGIGVVHTGGEPRGNEAPAVVAPPSPKAPGIESPGSENDDLALRVQSLLASSEWLAEQGRLEEAYRNTIIAQHLAEHGELKFAPGDRVPAEVSHQIWEEIQARQTSSEIALSLPKPQLPKAAQRRPVPDGAFPDKNLAWHRVTGPSPLTAPKNAMPVIAPRGNGPQPGADAAVTGDSSTQTQSPSAVPGPQEMRDVASARTESPVTLTNIVSDAAPAAATAGQPALPPPGGSPARPQRQVKSGVVNAVAEAPAVPPRGRQARPSAMETTSLTVPAMASLPKTDAAPPLVGPSLTGPQLAQAVPAPAPPHLEVLGARKLPTGPTIDSQGETKRGILWGMLGLIVGLLGAAFGFRRKWSAGTAGPKGA